MTQKQQRGKFYWGVHVAEDVDESGIIWVTADDYFVQSTGVLEFVYECEEGKHHSAMMLAPGKWSMVFAASVVDGSPVAVTDVT